MNLFNKAIYKNHLEHTAEGTKWGKHKYLYITPSGRYVYPYDLENTKTSNNPKLAAEKNRSKIKAASDNVYKDQIRSAHQGSALRNDNSISRSKRVDSSGWRTQSIANVSGQKYGQQIEAQKRAEEERRKNTVKTSSVAAGSKSVASNPDRNSITIKNSNTEDKKTETTTTNTGDKYKNMSEETKAWLMKGGDKEKKGKTGSSKKGGSGKKKGSSAKSSTKATKTEEQKQMGLSDDDLKKMEVNTQATDREDVLKNIALRVIRGDYGNGADRKAKLGNYYNEVQNRVNELMRSGNIQREGQSQQQTQQAQTEKKDTTSNSASISKSSTDSKKETNTHKTETQKKNAEEIQVARQLADMSGMKNSATLDLIRLYKSDSNSEKFQEKLKILSEGDEKQAKNMLRVLGRMKHSDLEEGMFLAHWGIKRRSGRFKFGSGDRPYQHESGRYARKNSNFFERRSMSDDELKARIERAKNESELLRLERSNLPEGQKFVEDVLKSVGRGALTTVGKGAALYGAKKFCEKVLKDEELAKAVWFGGPEKKKK